MQTAENIFLVINFRRIRDTIPLTKERCLVNNRKQRRVMLKFQLSLPSQFLFRPVTITGAIPYGFMSGVAAHKIVWGLHCAMEDGDFFFHKLNISSLVDKYGFAFIAPSLGNGYFINSPYEKQADFLQKELMPVLQEMLPFSKHREDNSLLGISMGAFGAAHWALSCPDAFGAVAAISGMFDASIPVDERARKSRELRPLVRLFSDKIEPLLIHDEKGNISPDADIRPLYACAAKKGAPEFALWYGEEDWLCLNDNKAFARNCKEQGIRVLEHIAPGGHNLTFWHKAIPQAVAWLMEKNTKA